jgi:hypothetical protein
MGLNYSFAFYTKRSMIESALRVTSSIVDHAKQKDWLLRGVPYDPEASVTFIGRNGRSQRLDLGVKGMDLFTYSNEHSNIGNNYGLSLFLPNDTDYWHDETPWVPGQPISRPVVVSVGLIYLSIFAGEMFSIVRLTAAASCISRHFQYSLGTHNTMAALSRQMEALACVLELEGNGPNIVVGQDKHIGTISLDNFEVDQIASTQPAKYYQIPDVDECAMQVLKQCGISVPSEGPGQCAILDR